MLNKVKLVSIGQRNFLKRLNYAWIPSVFSKDNFVNSLETVNFGPNVKRVYFKNFTLKWTVLNSLAKLISPQPDWDNPFSNLSWNRPLHQSGWMTLKVPKSTLYKRYQTTATAPRSKLYQFYNHFQVASGQMTSLPGYFRSPEVTCRHFTSCDGLRLRATPCRKWNVPYTRLFGLLQPLPGDFW